MIALRRAFVLAIVMLVAVVACDEASTPNVDDAPPKVQREHAPRTIEGGLVIHDVVVGEGPIARSDSTVEINFVAMLADGTVWDSTAKRRRTLSFSLDSPALIRGLRQGIEGMRIGGKRRLEIPWMLGYGETGRDPVPPMTNLVYEIELLGVHSPSTQDGATPTQ